MTLSPSATTMVDRAEPVSTMQLKSTILSGLGLGTLRQIVDKLEIDADRRSEEAMRTVVSRSRKVTVDGLPPVGPAGRSLSRGRTELRLSLGHHQRLPRSGMDAITDRHRLVSRRPQSGSVARDRNSHHSGAGCGNHSADGPAGAEPFARMSQATRRAPNAWPGWWRRPRWNPAVYAAHSGIERWSSYNGPTRDG